MRLAAAGLVVGLVLPVVGSAAEPWLLGGAGLPAGASLGSLPGLLDLTGELADADSWAERVLPLMRLQDPGLEVLPFQESRSLVELVAGMYGRAGLPWSAEDATFVEAQAAGLSPGLGWALQQLLGAVEHGVANWELAMSRLTPEDWTVLVARGWEAEEPLPASLVAKVDTRLLRGAALRLVGVLDEVSPWLQKAAVDAGPNDGEFLFRDPYDLILVGGTGVNTYRGNSAPKLLTDPDVNWLIVDLGGDDWYLNEPATAHPEPALGGTVGRGAPVSVVIDMGGNDMYVPFLVFKSALAKANLGGIAILADFAGNDVYWSGVVSQAAAGTHGVALLLDAAGDDAYSSPGGSQAYAIDEALAILYDSDDSDVYGAGGASQGRGVLEGVGVLVDTGGNDQLVVGAGGQGYGWHGVGLFLNIGGDDTYLAGGASQGYADACWQYAGCIMGLQAYGAVFLDLCGTDTYYAPLGRDGASWQQGTFGYGYDVNHAGLCE